MPAVYIETTIPSYYHETRRSPTVVAWRGATRRWWDEYRRGYDLFTSAHVLAELELAPGAKAARALEMLKDVPLLQEPAGFEEVTTYYIEHQLMPKNAQGDAAHLAMASMHRMDFLLTWNCCHLANANKVQHLSVLNARLALPVPVMTTPLMLVPESG